ncbi:hypothetical protein ACFRFQ_13885 [Rhodococcus sp. NPDC056743]|uniref:hypothetical protein n=1 Tax=Rhodococcus sp. NPDC056743 TaxID=3345934 RepID=UPI003671D016
MSADFDPTLTRSAAQAQVIDNLTNSLEPLPAGSYLTRRSAVDPTRMQSAGATVPCDDSNLSENTSVDYNVRYYLRAAQGQEVETFADLINSAWKQRNWATRTFTTASSTNTEVISPTGYRMILEDGGSTVSLVGSSPCFPRPDINDRPDAPETIERP